MNTKLIKYKSAREMSCNPQTAKHYTLEQAAEELFTSVSTIKCIESGQRKCSSDMAEAMAKLYDAPWVADPTIPDDYKPKPMAQAMLSFENAREDVTALMARARRILADGVVADDEVADYQAFLVEVEEAVGAARDVFYAV